MGKRGAGVRGGYEEVVDHETAWIMSRWKVAMMHEEWVEMLLEEVFLPRDSFMLPNGL